MFTFLTSLLITIGYSQTKKEYWDPLTKTQLMAEYQMNSTGEKDGWFKGYDKQGILIYEYNYQKNLFHGLNIEYTTYSGKREIAKSENYNNGILHGRAKYYGQGGLLLGEGDFVQGKKNGKWFEVESYSNYDLLPGEIKGFEYIAFPGIEWKDGERAKQAVVDGQYTYFFYPTKKVRSVVNFKNSKMVGLNVWYHPSGSIESKAEYDNNGELLYSMAFYPNGKMKEYTGLKDGIDIFEQYDKNGQPTREMESWKRNKEKILKERKFLQLGDSLLIAGNINLAVGNYQKAGEATYDMYGNPNPEGYKKKKVLDQIIQCKRIWNETQKIEKALYEIWSLSVDDFIGFNHEGEFTAFIESSISSILLESAQLDPETTLKIISAPKYSKLITSETKNNLLADINRLADQAKQAKDLSELILLKKSQFESKFMTVKNTGGYDAMGNPLTLKSYPYGEALYSKVFLLIDPCYSGFKSASSFELKIQKANEIIEIYEKILVYPADELKSLNKELKKTNDIQVIRSILKV